MEDNVSMLLGDGDGGFAAADDYNVGDFPIGMTVVNLDRADGPDITVANANDDNVSVLLNEP